MVEARPFSGTLAGVALSVAMFAPSSRRTGAPPHRRLTSRRLARAKELLAATDMTLAEIAIVCGFTDQSYFTQIFARYEGSSPGRWRRER